MFRIIDILGDVFFRLTYWLEKDCILTRGLCRLSKRHPGWSRRLLGSFLTWVATPAILAVFIYYAIATYSDPLPPTALPGARGTSFALLVFLGLFLAYPTAAWGRFVRTHNHPATS